MILSGNEICKNIGSRIIIEPFDENRINPNSYNLSLHDTLQIYTAEELDFAKNNPVKSIVIPADGYVLQPGQLYLARSLEYTETHGFVPMLIGRSSVGRLGVTVHITSGFGDIGFSGYWTMQLTCIKPVRIYAGMKICQIFYQTVLGEYEEYRSLKYQNSQEIKASQMYLEFQNE